MTQKKRFTDFEKGIIAGHVNNSWAAHQIAKKYGWRRTSVQFHVSRFQKSGQMRSKQKNCGRHRKTDARDNRAIGRGVVGTPEKRRKSAKELCMELDLEVHERTVRRRLVEQDLHGCVAARVPHLRPQNVEKRLKWAEDHLSWSEKDLDRVIWSDESPFVLFGGKTRSRVRRKEEERLHPHWLTAPLSTGPLSTGVVRSTYGDVSRRKGWVR